MPWRNRVGRNNICEYLLFEMALGRHENTKFCTHKLENQTKLDWQGWAGIMYVNIFYLKWLWEGMKTPSFAHKIESALAGVGRNNIISSIWNGFGKAWKHQVLLWEGTKLENLHWQGWAGIIYVNIFYLKWLWEGMESALAGVGRNNICAYLLFEMALGRHENTKFCTRNWRICTGRGGQE